MQGRETGHLVHPYVKLVLREDRLHLKGLQNKDNTGPLLQSSDEAKNPKVHNGRDDVLKD